LKKIKSFFNSIKPHKGFTLIELLVALAVTGLIVGAITTATGQIININSSNKNRLVAIKQLENAVDTMRVDLQMAQDVYYKQYDEEGEVAFSPDEDHPNIFLNLTWTDWDNDTTKIIYYSWSSDTRELTRESEGVSTRVIARDIAYEPTVEPADGKWVVTLTAVSGDYKSAEEVRTFSVLPRSGS